MDANDDPDDAHLHDLADGCGCTEVWEHTSARRREERDRRNDGGED